MLRDPACCWSETSKVLIFNYFFSAQEHVSESLTMESEQSDICMFEGVDGVVIPVLVI